MGTNDFRAEVTIVRKAGQQWDKFAASEDFDVQPGDVIDAPCALPRPPAQQTDAIGIDGVPTMGTP
jgi:hypothetical protein